MEKNNYRSDIDGLRAIAVLAVLVFHTDRSLLSGGFVGVDIFFVISGYLITSIIINDIINDSFSLLHFYDRRIRRIIPALVIFLLVSSVASYFILFPNDLYKYVKSLLASLLFFSNIYFWKNSGYFSPTSESHPLLHTWSLSIEEQFYLLFPVFLIITVHFSKNKSNQKIVFLLVLMFILSFALSVWGVENKPTATFYLLPTRTWELLLGVLLALSPNMFLSSIYRNFLMLGGIMLLSTSFFILNKELKFPGENALFPCLGAALVIFANHKEKQKILIGKLLSVKPLVFVGLISYSLYLWHWGIIVYYKQYTFEKPSLLFVVISSFLIASLSWKFIEQPFRRTRKKLLPYFSLVLIIMSLIIFVYLVYFSKGLPKRLPKQLTYVSVDGAKKIENPYRGRCFSKWGIDISTKEVWEKSCRLGSSDDNKKISFVFMGDSHANALFTGIDSVSKKINLKGIFFGLSSCSPIQGMYSKRSNDKCEKFKKVFYEEIYKHKSIKMVVLSSRWASYLYGNTFDLGPAEPVKTPVQKLLRLSEKSDEILSQSDREVFFALKMRETVTSLVSSGKKVVLFASVPEIGYHVPRYMARKEMSSLSKELVHNKKYFYKRQKFILNLFSKLSKIDGVIVLYPHKKLCTQESDTCLYQINGKPLYYDDDHLSIFGAGYIAPMIESSFRNFK